MSEKSGLDSASINIMGAGDIDPATITFISVPDYDYTTTGSISVSGSSEVNVRIGNLLDSSWNVEGVFSSGFTSEWAVGEGELYWYRVQSSCGEMRCDTNGILYPDCRNMTFMTVVPARNLAELCGKLANPSINPPVNLRVTSVKKYSRPVERSELSPECNSLEDQDFCQIAECLDYCLDQDVRQIVSFSMRAIESILEIGMSGGPVVRGQVQTNRHRVYIPEFPAVGVSGSSATAVSLVHVASGSLVAVSGSSSFISSAYTAQASGGTVLGGYARTVSPSRKYSDMEGLLELGGESRLYYAPRLSSSVEFSGSASTRFAMRFNFSGKVEIEGRIMDYTSPTYRHHGSGSLTMSGSPSLNFSDLGVFSDIIYVSMSAFDFSSESTPIQYGSRLTISDYSVSPSCGCGPMGLSLSLRSNIANSSFLSAFLKRAGLSMPDPVLRFRSGNISWDGVQHFAGRGRDGVSVEDLRLSYSLSCSDGFWVFSFSASTFNRTTLDEYRTKFILDIPADLICSDGNVSTRIEMDINSGEFQVSTGTKVSVMDPPRPLDPNPKSRRVDAFVDGFFNDKRVYYDELGVFKDSYWSSKRLKMEINPVRAPSMQRMQFSEIFQS